MTNLFISLFDNPVRNKEYHRCLIINAQSNIFDNVFILAEPKNGVIIDGFNYLPDFVETNAKIQILPISKRPTFRSFFNAINIISRSGDDVNIIANSDIYFKELPHLPKANDCFALTRYEPTFFLNRADSQDVWMFRGAINVPKYCDFGMGVPGCDNRISWELNRHGYNVINPSLTIKTYHLHKEPTDHSKAAKRIAPPYLKLTPCAINIEDNENIYRRISI